MSTSQNNTDEIVTAVRVDFSGDTLQVLLSDGRKISLPLDQITWLDWLATATPAQRANWSLEPGGYAIYWDDLDDGIEVMHLLNVQPIV